MRLHECTSVIPTAPMHMCATLLRNGSALLQVQERALLPGSALFEAAMAAGHAARANDGSSPAALGLAVTSATIAAPLELPEPGQPQPSLKCLITLRWAVRGMWSALSSKCPAGVHH